MVEWMGRITLQFQESDHYGGGGWRDSKKLAAYVYLVRCLALKRTT